MHHQMMSITRSPERLRRSIGLEGIRLDPEPDAIEALASCTGSWNDSVLHGRLQLMQRQPDVPLHLAAEMSPDPARDSQAHVPPDQGKLRRSVPGSPMPSHQDRNPPPDDMSALVLHDGIHPSPDERRHPSLRDRLSPCPQLSPAGSQTRSRGLGL
jgi:hypothetical protein